MANICNELKILRKICPLRHARGEDRLANQVAQYLKALTLSEKLKAVWFHVPNESVVSERMDVVRIKRKQALGMINGAPDFVVTNGAKTVFIELKTDKGRQTESQKMFEKWCCKCGITYEICRSVDDVSLVLVESGLMEGSN